MLRYISCLVLLAATASGTAQEQKPRFSWESSFVIRSRDGKRQYAAQERINTDQDVRAAKIFAASRARTMTGLYLYSLQSADAPGNAIVTEQPVIRVYVPVPAYYHDYPQMHPAIPPRRLRTYGTFP